MIKSILRFVRDRILISLLVALSISNFKVRKYIFGFENACNFLRSLSDFSIIPILKSEGANIGKESEIQSGITFHNCKSFHVLKIGTNCSIGKNCFIDLRGNVTISDNVVISMNCTFLTHIDMNPSKLRKLYPADQKDIYIGNHSYIGSNAVILMGIKTGEYSFIAAKSLVNKDIEPNSLVAGVPAVHKKYMSI